MRILAVTSSFPRHADDHAGRFVFDLAAGLVEEGCAVTTLCPAAAGAPAEEEGEAGRVVRLPSGEQGALFYGDGMEENWRRARRPGRELKGWLMAVRSFVRAAEGSFDAVLAHWLFPGAWAAARSGTRRPIAAVGHGGDLHLLGRPLLGRALGIGLAGRLHAALVTTRSGARLVAERLRVPPARIAVSPMGVDPRVFAAAGPVPPEWPPRYVLGVGRLVEVKGFDLLVRAAAELGVPLVLLGEGPERARLAALGRDLGADLRMPGLAPRALVASALRGAAALAVPSRVLAGGRTEGTPVAAVEALVAGCPVVGAEVGGLADLLDAGRLFAPGDLAGLRERLRAALAEEKRARPCPPGLTRRETARTLLGLL